MTVREIKDFKLAEVLSIYSSVGWVSYTNNPEMLRKAYEHSLLALGAYDGERLVGIIRVVGDGCSIVFIQDLIVLSDYRRQGIGTQLIKEVMGRYESVYQIELLTDDCPETAAFYQNAGFGRADDMGCCSYIRMRG